MELFERLETHKGVTNAVIDSFKTFSSLLRLANIAGILVVNKLFPEEYESKKNLLESNILQGCTAYANRATAEKKHLKHGGKILEIGVASGSHASSLVQSLRPSAFHGVDIQLKEGLRDEHRAILENYGTNLGELKLYQCDSIKFLEERVEQKEAYDFIYIDANHKYAYVNKELELSAKLVNIGGHIVLNDYMVWFVRSMEPCGVIKATNNFLNENKNWKVEYFTFNDNDICLKRIE